MYKETDNTSEKFIRSVEAAPEPMCILCTDQQLSDIEKFCTGQPFSVISIDPTFNLGKFYVTPITIQNLLLETKNGSYPIVLGPVLVHQTKLFRPFYYFASTLVRLRPSLAGIKCYGTDGEFELIKALTAMFPSAIHLRCANHLRQNLKQKLTSLNLDQNVQRDIIADIFGRQVGTHSELGLVDAESKGFFWKALANLKERWNNLELSCRPMETPQFYEWFYHHKATDFANCVIREVRRKAGLTNLFTTNCSESLNHMLKLEFNWKESRLPALITHIKDIVKQQMSELEKAIIGRGEWQFRSCYSGLRVNEQAWFTGMTKEAKDKHIKKF